MHINLQAEIPERDTFTVCSLLSILIYPREDRDGTTFDGADATSRPLRGVSGVVIFHTFGLTR